MYRTKTAHELIDDLHCRLVRTEDKLAKSTDGIERANLMGWRDATELALEEIARALPVIETEAELVPAPSAEQWLVSEHMAGDLRDFPAVA